MPSSTSESPTAEGSRTRSRSRSRSSHHLSSPPPPPPPSRLTRIDFAAYASYLDNIEVDSKRDLAKLLLQRRKKGRPANSDEGRTEISNDAGDEDQDDDDDDAEEEDDEAQRQRSGSSLRRVDGPEFVPLYQDAVHSTAVRKRKRVRDSSSVADDNTRWPLSPSELPLSTIASLEEAIINFASAYIREHHLSLPSREHSMTVEDDTPLLPPSLVQSTTRMLNQALVNIAGVRPAVVKKRRKAMMAIDGAGVLNIASMDPNTRLVVRTANDRLREIYRPLEPDVLTYRLNLLDGAKDFEGASPDSSSLYASVLPKQDRATRPHQSQAELERRAERRRLREEKRQLRAEKRKSAVADETEEGEGPQTKTNKTERSRAKKSRTAKKRKV
nr:uncharacterized protein CI109_007159 [Kwoniella shandongensis]KAA5524504.1 hypothetical protein CI109_007159 [Kwoniella shandongensis]